MSEAAAAGFHLVSRIGFSTTSSTRSSFNNRLDKHHQKQQLLNSTTRFRGCKITAASSSAGSETHDSQQQQQSGSMRKRGRSPRRRLIKISTGEGRWNKNYSHNYSFSFWDLQLEDLIQDDDDATVSVNLSVDKHASFGFSVDGTIVISFTRKCSNCNSPYSTKIDTKVNVWVLPSSRDQRHDRGDPLPVIGGEDDPSVIYVKPGHEADLDSLVKDSVRLAISVKDTSDTCSERCEKMQPQFHYIGKRNDVGVDKRWSSLLQLKKQITNNQKS
ncbi:Large ribosomal RNA subunit accumulation protein YCED homolog 2, chloroplastic [Linum perenne]